MAASGIRGSLGLVSAGDGAAAGCDDFDTATFVTGGIAVNAIGSTPFNFATGGTDFADTFAFSPVMTGCKQEI